MLKQLATLFALACAVVNHGPAQVKPASTAAPKTSTPAKKPVAAQSTVDTVIELVKNKMPESMVIKTLQRDAKPINLTPADLLKLQKAGVSENIMNAMMDPSAVVAAAPVAAPPPTPENIEVATVPVSLPTVRKAPQKRRIAVKPFEYSAGAHWAGHWFHGRNVNIGEGIRAMLTARLAQSKSIIVVERADKKALDDEKRIANTIDVNQGTKVKMGKTNSADCILLGDITIFGRDDKAESSRKSGLVTGPLSRMIPGANRYVNMGRFSKEEKAVVAIALRIVDTETSDILETAEARGESSRSSKKWDAVVIGNHGGARAEGEEMTSSNFQETIIGEATSDAVNKAIQWLDGRVAQIPLRSRQVEGRVAHVSGNTIILAIGSGEGVENGDKLEVLQILSEVKDPETGAVIDVSVAKVGEMVVTDARPKSATGSYSGKPLPQGAPPRDKGYTARLMQ